MNAHFLRALVALILALALLPSAALAQASEERVDVRLVHVDVLVVDKKEVPVRGLEAKAFQVKVDGKKVKLAAFEGLDDKRSAEDVTSWVVVLDDHFLTPPSRVRALAALEAFFTGGALEEGDGVVVARIQDKLEILTGRIDDPQLIRATLEDIGRKTPRLGGAQDPAASILEDLGSELRAFRSSGASMSMATPNVDLFAQTIRAYADEERRYALSSLGAIANLLAMGADLPGRRAVVHVSDGLPIRAGEELFTAVARSLEQAPQQGTQLGPNSTGSPASTGGGAAPSNFSGLAVEGRRFDITDELTQVAARANASRVSLYGLHAGGGSEAGAGALGASALGAGFQRARENNLRASLEFLADETSARAGWGRKDLGAFLEIVKADARMHYTIAFEPPGEPDGAVHEISVKVKGHRGRDRVRHRKSFLASTREVTLQEALVRRLVAGPVGPPQGWELAAGERSAHASGQSVLPLRASLPVSILREAGGRGEVEVLVALLTPEGAVTIPGELRIPYDVTGEAAQAAGDEALFPVEVSVLVSPGRARAALALRASESSPYHFVVVDIAP